MNSNFDLKSIAIECGMSEAGYVYIDKLVFHQEIRAICEGNACRNYGRTWACPPAVGTVEECKARVLQYDLMLLFSKKYELEDSFDFEGMKDGMLEFKNSVDRFQDIISTYIKDYLLLSNEGCGRCSECTYPNAECRFPSRLHHSLEGYGFIVSDLARAAGIKYINGEGTVTYFGALVFKT